MPSYIGGRLNKISKSRRGELLADYYYYDYTSDPDLTDQITALFEAEGYTLLSRPCAKAIDDALNDPTNAYLKYTEIRALYNTAGFTELSQTCSYNLDKAML